MKKKSCFVITLLMTIVLLTGCQMSKEDLLKNAENFDEYSYNKAYESNQKATKEKYKNKKYLFSGHATEVKDDYAIVESQMSEYKVYFGNKDLLNLSNDYLIRFAGTYSDVDDDDVIIVKNAQYIDDNVNLLGKIDVKDSRSEKGCYLEIGDDDSILLEGVDYSSYGYFCIYDGKAVENESYAVVNGVIRYIEDEEYGDETYKIEKINSIRYADSEKNKPQKDGVAKGTEEAFKNFGLSFDDFKVKYNYVSAEYVNGVNSYTKEPDPTLDINVYLKEKFDEKTKKEEYDKLLTYLKKISTDGKIYNKISIDTYEEAAEFKLNLSDNGFTTYVKIGNGIYEVELYHRDGKGGNVNSTYYKGYYLLHFFNYDRL